MHRTLPSSLSDPISPELDDEGRFLVAVAAGQLDLLPERLSDVDRLVGRIHKHRLEGRCRRHFQAFGERGYSSSLFRGIDDLCEATHRQYARNRQALESIAAVAEDIGVVFKGFAVYLLTGDIAMLRCGDIDIVAERAGEIVSSLLRSGFTQTRPPFLHEIGEFSRDGIEFDLQSSFPICRYPEGVSDVSNGPTARGLMINQHVDARAMQTNSRAPELGGGFIRVPCLELSVLIAVSHAFMNYTNLWSISHREKAWVRLAELADVRELAACRGFSPARFRELVTSFGGEDAIAWANWIWKRLTGSELLTGLGVPLPRLLPAPCCLWWNLWIRFEPPTSLLLRDTWYPTRQVLQLLEQSQLGATSGSDEYSEIESSTLLPVMSEAIGRGSVFRASARFCGALLELVLYLHDDRRVPRLRIRLDSGVDAAEIVIDTTDGALAPNLGKLHARASVDGLRFTIAVDLSALRLDQQLRNEGKPCGFMAVATEQGETITACMVVLFRCHDGQYGF